VGSTGQVRLSAIITMLEECAPGNTRVLKTHHYWIEYRGKSYRSLPKGAHGRTDPEIQAPFVRKLVSQLEISPECAKKHFPFIKSGTAR